MRRVHVRLGSSGASQLQHDDHAGCSIHSSYALVPGVVQTSRPTLRISRDASSIQRLPPLAHRDICCSCTRAVGIGGQRTSPTVYEYAAWFAALSHAAAPQIRQPTSPSGRLTKISTDRITVVLRNAASRPFHSFDCHIAKYSPAKTMKPTNQRAKPTVNPATAQPWSG